MQCESCLRPMAQVPAQSHFHCATCNKFQFPGDLTTCEDAIDPAGKTTEFHCPKCELELEVGQLRGMLDVCFCQNCRGFVIDSGSLGMVINVLRGSYNGPDDQPLPVNPEDMEMHAPCPACLDPMEAHPYYGPGNVVIDTCMHCRLAWFDHGELARIVRAPGVRPNSPSAGNHESAAIRNSFYEQGNSRGGQAMGLFFSGF